MIERELNGDRYSILLRSQKSYTLKNVDVDLDYRTMFIFSPTWCWFNTMGVNLILHVLKQFRIEISVIFYPMTDL